MIDNSEIPVKMAGAVGAIISTKFINGTIPEKISMAVAGVALSYYTSPWISSLFGVPDGVSGFLCGFFGMAVMSKAWETIKGLPIDLVWKTIVERIKK